MPFQSMMVLLYCMKYLVPLIWNHNTIQLLFAQMWCTLRKSFANCFWVTEEYRWWYNKHKNLSVKFSTGSVSKLFYYVFLFQQNGQKEYVPENIELIFLLSENFDDDCCEPYSILWKLVHCITRKINLLYVNLWRILDFK